MILYKNLRKVHLTAFKDHGSIRLGTLNAYRTIADSRRDGKEGLKEAQFSPEEDVFLSDGIPRNLLPPNVEIKGGYVYVAEGGSASMGIEIPDSYVFCVSTKPVKNKFGDAYYEIVNPTMFGDMLLEKLKSIDPQIYYGHLGRVAYGGTKDFQIVYRRDLEKLKDYNLSETVLADYFLKPACFSSELEFRYVFFTTKARLDRFVDLNCELRIVHACCKFN